MSKMDFFFKSIYNNMPLRKSVLSDVKMFEEGKSRSLEIKIYMEKPDFFTEFWHISSKFQGLASVWILFLLKKSIVTVAV